jgi:ribosomal protein S13
MTEITRTLDNDTWDELYLYVSMLKRLGIVRGIRTRRQSPFRGNQVKVTLIIGSDHE